MGRRRETDDSKRNYFYSDESAKRLGLSPFTLARWRREGIGPKWTRLQPGNPKSRVIIMKEDLAEWLGGSQRFQSISEERAAFRQKQEPESKTTDQSPDEDSAS